LELASQHGLTNAYDAQYLALAELEGYELWTADERLANSLEPTSSWLKLV